MFGFDPLRSILRAAHCHSVHHYFAIDALPMVQTDAGKRLVELLLHHHRRYLIGATDPDTRFRDFQNHVIHVTDGYWGGAPRVAHKWYDRMQRYLRTNRFSDAAHAAGVLSHYFTDPLQPLHTQQCDREKILHRPIEWSITRSYETIFRHWKEDEMRVVFQISDGAGWLGEAILHGARFANRKYKQLLDQYDLVGGLENPVTGLNAELRSSLAELIGLSITGWARVLERAADDAEAIRGDRLPPHSLSVPTLLATLRAPISLWARQIEYHEEQLAVAELIDEFRRTGTLNHHLPAEVDIVHRVVRVHDDERRWKQEREKRLASTRTVVKVEDPANPSFAPRLFNPEPLSRASLTHHDELIGAPSIGPKTAERFTAIDIHTVGDLLTASPADIAARLQTYWITADTVSQWQSQATLMCQVADLKPRDAQLLAGAGYDSAVKISECIPTVLHSDVSKFAVTTAGRRILRGSMPPSLSVINQWISNARASETVAEPTVHENVTPPLRRSA